MLSWHYILVLPLNLEGRELEGRDHQADASRRQLGRETHGANSYRERERAIGVAEMKVGPFCAGPGRAWRLFRLGVGAAPRRAMVQKTAHRG